MSCSKKVLIAAAVILLIALTACRAAQPQAEGPEKVLEAVLTAIGQDADPAQSEETYGDYFTQEGMEQALQSCAFTALQGEPGLEGPLGLSGLNIQCLTEREDEVQLYASFRVTYRSADSGEEVSVDRSAQARLCLQTDSWKIRYLTIQ